MVLEYIFDWLAGGVVCGADSRTECVPIDGELVLVDLTCDGIDLTVTDR